MKKAQTEMLGLLVIFILFIFIGLIYLKFSGGAKEQPMATSRMNLQGANMVSALMGYSICQGNSFRDALKQCIQDNGPVCGTPSCDAVKSIAEGVAKAVMGNDTYQLIIVGKGQDLVKTPQNDPKCKQTVVNTFNNTLVSDAFIRLKTCKKGTEIDANA